MRRLTTSLVIGIFLLWWIAPAFMQAQNAGKPETAAPATPEPKLPADKSPEPTDPPLLIPPAPVVPPGSGPATSVPPTGPAEVIPDSWGFGPVSSLGVAPMPRKRPLPTNKIDQPLWEAERKSVGCKECHRTTDSHTMHASKAVVLGCTDCHSGNPKRGLTKEQAHILPHNPAFWVKGANPINSHALLNHESPKFIQFFNPGDLRVADITCGPCHSDIVERSRHSMMNHGGMLWNAAAYNNGAIQFKNAIVGQAYDVDGSPLKLVNPWTPTAEETRTLGILPWLLPLPRFNRAMPGNTFRIFEKGGSFPLQLGIPSLDEPPGKPERRLSERGLGTLNRTDPLFLGAQKTRLHDPMLHFLGSNDHPGDYRSSGCTACHVVYANDRSHTNSGWWAKYGNQGLSFSKDPTIPKNQRGHPIMHQFTSAVPSSQCMNCHMHQGNLFVNPYLGYTWWDQETDGEHMYPKKQHDPTDDELVRVTQNKPEAAAARGLWKDLDFLEKTAELNSKLKHTQFADYHGHGWVYRAVFKQDKKGNRLDREGNKIPHSDFKHAVHLKDIHLEKGMQCGDCHFEVDVHGNGNLYGEPRNATTIMCIDCHGTVSEKPTLLTSGVSGKTEPEDRRKISPVNLLELRTGFGPRFEWKKDGVGREILIQYSSMRPDMWWEVPMTKDTVDPYNEKQFNLKSAYAKTLHRDGKTFGSMKLPKTPEDCKRELAHANENFDCQVCHTSWATSCFGCHLPLKINQRAPLNKYEATVDRGFTTYNPQVVRDDVFQLGIDGTVKKNRMAVLRSSSAVVVSSQNANREWVYVQQQTVSGEGYSGQAYNPHFAHTTSGVGTTKECTECHVSKGNDNNAWMASLLGFGTGTVNFFGRFAWVGAEKGVYGVGWTESDEPQAAIGSSFHKIAYPANYQAHVDKGRELWGSKQRGYDFPAFEHHAREVNDLTLRGEFLYTADGPAGLNVFDVANIEQKGFSERLVTGPFSPIGHRTYVRSPFATSVAMPSTLLNDPYRVRLPENEEQPIHPMYGYVFVTDLEKGMYVVNVGTLFDGNPENNFLNRAKLKGANGEQIGEWFNPDGKLTGATFAVCAGHRVFVCTARGLAIVDINEPERPRLVGEVADGFLRNPKSISVQFRYAFISDDDGLKVVDISNPNRPRAIPGAVVRLGDPHKLYVARTYAYVANGHDGLAIIDVQNPERPRFIRNYTAGGKINDARDVKIGSVAASMYALIAGGHNGLQIVQMISPDTVDGAYGFSPEPAPRLIATYHTHHAALAVTRGLDRDRVVDETGNQTVVFGRRGARPFNLAEMKKFYEHDGGGLYTVEDTEVRTVEETLEIETPGPNDTKIKTKTTRSVKKLFTKTGEELKFEMPPPPPWMNAAPVPTFKVPEKIEPNEKFLREGAKLPSVQELPMPGDKKPPGNPALKLITPPPIIQAPKPGATPVPTPVKKSSQ
ncbi:MAG: hypothetical protein ABMA13_07435 [Chthoniobacteraceae bacterium]